MAKEELKSIVEVVRERCESIAGHIADELGLDEYEQGHVADILEERLLEGD